MRLLLLLIICSFLTGCFATSIRGNISSSVDPSFDPRVNLRVVIVPQEFDSIYYLPALKDALQARGFRNVTVSNSSDVPLNSFDLKVALGVDRQSTVKTEMVDEYGVVATKYTPGDIRCKETNNGLTGKRMRCRSDEAKTENEYGVVGKKEKTTTSLNRSIALTFSRLPNDRTVVTTIGSSEEEDWKCSNSGIFNFLIIHTVKYLDFRKPQNTNYRIEVPEGYSCETFDEHERSLRNGVVTNGSNASATAHTAEVRLDRNSSEIGCVDGDCSNGEGTYLSSNGDRYIGQWKDGKKHGQGIYKRPDGRTYIGQFKYDNATGQGSYTWTNGKKYVGDWKNNKYNGYGTLIEPDGLKYIGEFKNDKKHGSGTLFFPNGDRMKGRWNDDVLTTEVDSATPADISVHGGSAPSILDGAYILHAGDGAQKGGVPNRLINKVKIYSQNRFMSASFNDSTGTFESIIGQTNWDDGLLVETPTANQNGALKNLSFDTNISMTKDGFIQSYKGVSNDGVIIDTVENWKSLSTDKSIFDGMWLLEKRSLGTGESDMFSEVKLIGGGHYLFFQSVLIDNQLVKHFAFGSFHVLDSGQVVETGILSSMLGWAENAYTLDMELIDDNHLVQKVAIGGNIFTYSYIRI
ncbi:hypothetical protein N9399_03210 [Porticoccaceae bacterium]|nr:hypothetical protein [Porticoccaceae bacterium]